MSKLTVVQVVYNSRRFIEPVFKSVFDQTFKDFNFVAVISASQDGSKELILEKFPQVEVIDPAFNIGFAAGHNLVFEKFNSDFFQLVNPDLILEPNYIEQMLKVFGDDKVGAVTGKLLKYDFNINRKTNIIDTTGVSIAKSGRGRDRGQHEVDNHQYDALTSVQAVSAAGAMYRRSALLSVKLRKIGKSENRNSDQLDLSDIRPSEFECFDEDFHSYWEDVDLAWRMSNAGWKNAYVPSAVAYHGRAAGSSRGGYLHIVDFIKHHSALNLKVRQLNYKNHIFMYLKNSRYFYPEFFVREFFMFFYVLFFEISTLKVLPEFFKQLPGMLKKRMYIKKQPFRAE